MTKKVIKSEVLFKRFLRGFVAGFAGSALTIGSFSGGTLRELGAWLMFVSIAGIAGGITGLLQTVDKALRWKE